MMCRMSADRRHWSEALIARRQSTIHPFRPIVARASRFALLVAIGLFVSERLVCQATLEMLWEVQWRIRKGILQTESFSGEYTLEDQKEIPGNFWNWNLARKWKIREKEEEILKWKENSKRAQKLKKMNSFLSASNYPQLIHCNPCQSAGKRAHWKLFCWNFSVGSSNLELLIEENFKNLEELIAWSAY